LSSTPTMTSPAASETVVVLARTADLCNMKSETSCYMRSVVRSHLCSSGASSKE
jgi:hypothetical protein